jgi:hypothetical protein
MAKETYKPKVKQVNHANQHVAQKTEVVRKDTNSWPYEYVDHKFPRNVRYPKPKH